MVSPTKDSPIPSRKRILSLLAKSPASIRQSFGMSFGLKAGAPPEEATGGSFKAAGRKLFQQSKAATDRASAILQNLKQPPAPAPKPKPVDDQRDGRKPASKPPMVPRLSLPTESARASTISDKLNTMVTARSKDTPRSRLQQNTARRQGRIVRQRLKYIALMRAQGAVNGRLECRAASDMVSACKQKLEQMAAALIQSTWHRFKAQSRARRLKAGDQPLQLPRSRPFPETAWLQLNTPRTAREAAKSCEGRVAKERLKYLASCRTRVAVKELGFLGKKAAEEMVNTCKLKLDTLCAVLIQAAWRGFAVRCTKRMGKPRAPQGASSRAEAKQAHSLLLTELQLSKAFADRAGPSVGLGSGGAAGEGAELGLGPGEAAGSGGGGSTGVGGGKGIGGGVGGGTGGGRIGGGIGGGGAGGGAPGASDSGDGLMNAKHYSNEIAELNRQITGLDSAMSSMQLTESEQKEIMSKRKVALEKKKREAKAKEKAAAEAAKRKADEEARRKAEGNKPAKSAKPPLPKNVAPPPLVASKGAGKGKGKGKGPPVRGKGKGKGSAVIPGKGRWALPELNSTENTVWGSGQAVVLDDSISGALLGLFQKQKGQEKAKSAKATPKVSSVINQRRAHRGGILLAQFRDRFDDVRSALLTADTEFLTLERINSLLEIVPSDEELEQCRQYNPKQGERVVETVEYFRAIGDIPRMEQRLHMLKMKHTFSTAIDQLKTQISRYIEACEEVSCDQRFRRVLEVALELGNTFNGQKACGTQFTALLNFLGMKASNNSRITLLHYLASVLQHKMPELYDFHTTLEKIFKTTIRPENVIELDMRDLSGQIMLANDELGRVAESQETAVEGDVFYSNVTGFCATSAEEMTRIEQLFETMQRRTYATTAYFGEPNMSMDKLFEKLSDFLVKYKAARAEHGRLIKDGAIEF